MKGDAVSPGLGKGRDHDLRVVHHEMHIQRKVSELSDVRHGLWSEAEVENEVSIHYIDVNPVGPGVLNELNAALEITKVRREN